MVILLAPFIITARYWPNVFNAIFYNDYVFGRYPYHYTSLKEFLCAVYCEIYPILVVLLFLIFLPFQLIKNYCYKKGRKLSFMEKIGLMALIVIGIVCFFGTFTNLWLNPLHHNVIYIGIALGIAVVFTPIFHFLVDRYEK